MKILLSPILAFLVIILTQACNSDLSDQPKKNKIQQDTTHNLQVTSGHINRYHFSSDFVDARNVDIWLPDNYSSSNKYSVLYMHDGQMLFDSSKTWNNQEWKVDEVAGKLISEDKISPVIVVGIWNNDDQRFAEYFPAKAVNYIPKTQRDSLMKLGPVNLKADYYLKFLVSELKPFIDSTYSTQPGSEHTYLMGSSMGGLISIYGLSEYPDLFGGAACLSTHWIGTSKSDNIIPKAINSYLSANLPSPENHKIYFDHGTATLDSLYPPYQDLIDQTMRDKGYTPENWISREFEGADHSEKSWSNRLHIPLTFLLEK
ncbi:alpha/beta hydrolase [Fodinibius sp. SL11]|uniref:alpha/beta hydrolase n=1 Tax=Fodinibius sp. SL11 TaxID=3425690 RepID=UPI003F881E4A